MNIVDYLKSKVDYSVGDNTVKGMLLDRGVNYELRARDVAYDIRQLLYADLLMYGVTIYGSSIKRGDFSRSQNKVDVAALKREAKDIYKIYGDEKYDSKIDTSVTVKWIEEYE